MIRKIAKAAPGALSGEFAALYARLTRRSLAPARPLRAMPQAFHSMRSERQLIERPEHQLQDDRAIEIEFAHRLGDELTLAAERATSATAC